MSQRHMQSEVRSPVLIAVRKLLADGEWVSGPWLMAQVKRSIPAEVASRVAIQERLSHGVTQATVDAVPDAEKVEAGRHSMVRQALSLALRRGSLVADVPAVTKAHWRGDIPWQIRDQAVRERSIEQMASHLGIGATVLRTWIRNGYVPPTTTTLSGLTRIPQEHWAIYEAVKEDYIPGSPLWKRDPRRHWDPQSQPPAATPPPPAGAVCPKCNTDLVVELRLAAEIVGGGS